MFVFVREKTLWIFALTVLLASGCKVGIGTAPPAPTVTRPILLTPYWTLTPETENAAQEPDVTATGRPATPTPPPTPTPTPVVYRVKKGDTLLGIALQNGLTLEELQAANPEVDPNLLSVDTALVLPPPQATSTPGPAPTPGPEPVEIGEPRCYAQGDGARWCFAAAYNPSLQPVENVTAWLYLYMARTGPLTGTETTLPLNLLPPGRRLPLAAWFSPTDALPGEETMYAAAELRSALAVEPAAGRYLGTTIQVARQEITSDGWQASVRGWISLQDDRVPAGTVSLAAVAYTKAGEIAGVRAWHAGGGIAPGGSLRFDVTVYSAGPPIARVEVLAEARP
jgi:LysM repeat protein